MVANEPGSVVIATLLALPLFCYSGAMARELFVILKLTFIYSSAQGVFQEARRRDQQPVLCREQVPCKVQHTQIGDQNEYLHSNRPLDRKDEAYHDHRQLVDPEDAPDCCAPGPCLPDGNPACGVARDSMHGLGEDSEHIVKEPVPQEEERDGRSPHEDGRRPVEKAVAAEGLESTRTTTPTPDTSEPCQTDKCATSRKHMASAWARPRGTLPRQEAEEYDRVTLMQRRKRGRSPTPRRRRRHQWQEEQRRLANRAKWTRSRGRSAPSRAPEVVETSSTRVFPKAPWKRDGCGGRERAEIIPDEEEAHAGEPASSSNAGPPVPGLQEFDPNVRWWSNLTGFTDPFDDGEVQSLLSPETSRTLIANLQGLDVGERARVTTSLLAFVGLFIAELMKVVNDAQFGDRVELLQRELSTDVINLRQRQPVDKPGTFAKTLVDLQAKLEKKGKGKAALAARRLQEFLRNLGSASSNRARDRRERLQALLIAFEEEGEAAGDAGEQDANLLWSDLCPFLSDAVTGARHSSGTATSSAAGALDSGDEREGILVKRKPDGDWQPATHRRKWTRNGRTGRSTVRCRPCGVPGKECGQKLSLAHNKAQPLQSTRWKVT